VIHLLPKRKIQNPEEANLDKLKRSLSQLKLLTSMQFLRKRKATKFRNLIFQ